MGGGNAQSSAAGSTGPSRDSAQPPDEQSFSDIVRRYGEMVYGVCRRVTGNSHDAEDAAQAVFLTLAAQGQSQTKIRSMGAWLGQVAANMSMDIRRSRKRRLAREERHGQILHDKKSGNGGSVQDAAQLADVKRILSDELSKLPVKYRLPIILHYYGGLERDDIARELRCTVSTLGVRLFRARKILHRQLRKRGVSLDNNAMSALLMGVVRSTVAQGAISSEAAVATSIAQGIASTFFLSKAKVAGVLFALAVLTIASRLGRAWARELPSTLPQLQSKLRNLLPSLGTPLFSSPPHVDARQERNQPGLDHEPNQAVARGITNVPLTNLAPAAHGPILSMTSSMSIPQLRPQAWPPSPPLLIPSPLANFQNRLWGLGHDLPTPYINSNAVVSAGADFQFAVSGNNTSGSVVRKPTPAPQPKFQKMEMVQTNPPSTPTTTTDGPPPDSDHTTSVPSHPTGQAPLRLATAQDLTLQPATWVDNHPTDTIAGATLNNSSGNFIVVTNSFSGSSTDAVLHYVSNSPGVSGQLLTFDGHHDTAPLSFVPSGTTAPNQTTWSVNANSLTGYGTPLYATFDQNGQVTANGVGANQTLDLSQIQKLTNSTDNPAYHGPNGWRAINTGKLLLPAIHAAIGTDTYNWGEQAGDATIDLVNSVRLHLAHLSHDGDVQLALLSPDRPDIPAFPNPHGPIIGLWSIADTGATYDHIDLTIRYDDSALTSLDEESNLQLWAYSGSWHRITDSSLSLDTTYHLISGDVGSPTFFAVVAPEPAMAAALLLTGGAMLLKRRRRER